LKILHLTPGTGSFHCGSCLRDNALVKALRARGHDAMLVPLYLPLVTDFEVANPEQPVRVGGISLFLQQKFSWFKYVPRPLHRLLDHPALLRWASRRMGLTGARGLGEMTVGSLLGEKSPQWEEWETLVRWVEHECRPDVVVLSNSLLCGLAPALSRFGLPVLCSLQGEDGFLDTLIEPYRSRAWDLMQHVAQSVACFVAPSRFYADLMSRRMGVDMTRMSVVYDGLNFAAYTGEQREPVNPTIGYLARMIHGKGLTTLVDSFIQVVKGGRVPGVRLRVAGAVTPADEKYVDGLKQKLRVAGASDRVSWEPNVSFEDKVRFLHEISVFSVPATCGEAFGLYVIEAQACGVPVVQPRHGAFPELLEATRGGVLCEADDAGSLAESLEKLLLDRSRRDSLSHCGARETREQFSAARMAENFEAVLMRVTAGRAVSFD
jgi:glycosyltransferase involved in cell wall biosynthesis